MIREPPILPHRCPLKPSLSCEGTIELATASRCIGCPLLVQYEQLMVSELAGVPA